MKALIVDDEPPARRELRRLLAEFPWIEIVGEAGNVDEAAGKVASLSPDLLFLDIQMPGGSGFDLLARLDYAPGRIHDCARRACGAGILRSTHARLYAQARGSRAPRSHGIANQDRGGRASAG
jgi:DNA-binding LytR/AlgR family response regulator